MPTYAMLSTLGPGGWATLRDHPERLNEVTAEVESLGLTVVAQYALFGQWDFLNIIEAPDEGTMAKAAVDARGRGERCARRRCRHCRSRRCSKRSAKPPNSTGGPFPQIHHMSLRRSSRTSVSSKSTGSTEPSDRRRTRYRRPWSAGSLLGDLEPSGPSAIEARSNLDAGPWVHRSIVNPDATLPGVAVVPVATPRRW